MRFDSELEDRFYKRFNDLKLKFITSNKPLSIKTFKTNMNQRLPFDFTINIGATPIAIVELKNTQSLKVFDFSKLDTYASENDIRFYILSDGEQFIVTDRKKGFEKINVSFDEFIEIISESKEINIDGIKLRIAIIINELIQNSEFKILQDHIQNLDRAIINELGYNEITQRFSFNDPSNINNVENRIFRALLKDDKKLRKIYRYTTLNTVFSCLKNNTYRINCLVGMNDTSEVNYVENYVFGVNKDYTTASWNRIESYNNKFISSCSLKRDDLTQWRLYADDSKGVCLELKVLPEQLDTNFILKKICYGKIGNNHPELELIKSIRSRLKDDLDIDFEFKTLNTWKHFFKPYDYAVEQEVRLLYLHNNSYVLPKKDWVLTTSHQILNPFVDFKLNDPTMPIRLTKIVLGSKCPENKINKKQFQQYIRELRQNANYDLDGVLVGLSSINNYR